MTQNLVSFLEDERDLTRRLSNSESFVQHSMVYLVAGYILDRNQVIQWCKPRDITPPDIYHITVFVNAWLAGQNIKTRLLAVDVRGDCMYLVVTKRLTDPTATRTDFTPLKEDDWSRNVKQRMGMGDVEFVTIADPYFEYE